MTLDIFTKDAGCYFSGFYRGEVVYHCANGKIKVFIPGVYPDDWKENHQFLPECELAVSLFGGSNSGNGLFSYPNYGTIVWCFFLNNDQNFPVAFACTLGGVHPGEIYNSCKCDSSAKAKKDGTGAFIHVVNVDLTNIKLYESGQIEITTYDVKTPVDKRNVCYITVAGTGNLTILTTQKITLSSANSIEINSPKFDLNATNISLIASKLFVLSCEHYSSNVRSDYHVESPKIDLNASAGDYLIRSKTDLPLYRC